VAYHRVNILDLYVHKITMGGTMESIETFIEAEGSHMVVTFNTEMAVMAQGDLELKEAILKADLVVPDSVGILWAAHFYGQAMPERVTGVDLIYSLLDLGSQKGWRIYLLGGEPGVAQKAGQTISEKFPGMEVVGAHHGFFGPEEEEHIIGGINDSMPDILLVGMGVPKQEKWISRNLSFLNVSVAIGVGGTLDILAGKSTRAPLWVQKVGLEWLYRILRQPQRLPRALALPKFVLLVLMSGRSR
jgi:N-acetylglucosaminyldiphosphoundecaprenol N-acetyl-beta-D-mannosaminyltransferase